MTTYKKFCHIQSRGLTAIILGGGGVKCEQETHRSQSLLTSITHLIVKEYKKNMYLW